MASSLGYLNHKSNTVLAPTVQLLPYTWMNYGNQPCKEPPNETKQNNSRAEKLSSSSTCRASKTCGVEGGVWDAHTHGLQNTGGFMEHHCLKEQRLESLRMTGHFLRGVQQVAAILHRVSRVWHFSGVLSAQVPKMRISKHSC